MRDPCYAACTTMIACASQSIGFEMGLQVVHYSYKDSNNFRESKAIIEYHSAVLVVHLVSLYITKFQSSF